MFVYFMMTLFSRFIGMISHKKSLITIFGHKPKLKISSKNFIFFTPPCCYHKGQIVNSTMFDKGRLTLILFFQLNLSYINKPFCKMPKNSNFLIRLETGCTVCLHQVYTKENKRNITWYRQQNLSLLNMIE